MSIPERSRRRDVEAVVTFLPTEHGGRGVLVDASSGAYRPQFYYAGHDWDARYEYPDVEQVHPGDTVRTYLAFLNPQAHLRKLRPGTPFLIREGHCIVGYGSITQVLELEAWAKAAVARERGTD